MLIWNKASENAITEDGLEMIEYLHTDCTLNVISVHTVMTQETSSAPRQHRDWPTDRQLSIPQRLWFLNIYELTMSDIYSCLNHSLAKKCGRTLFR